MSLKKAEQKYLSLRKSWKKKTVYTYYDVRKRSILNIF